MRELTLFFEAASHDQPLAICIEDLHWTDASTVDVLAHLAARLDRMRLLLVVTYRQHELALRDHPFVRVRAELVAHGQLEEVPVSLLTPGEVRQYVSAMFDGREMSEELPRFVFQKTEGNPLFMADLVRYLQKHSALLNAREQNDVPDSLRALIERLLGDLQPDSRELLSIAAVQGYEFDSATVARVSALPAADVEERLRRIDKVHALITLQREAALPDGTITLAYRFAHVLYQDALNDSIAPSRRLELARRVAEALMTLHAGRTDAIAAQLAQLFETGRDFWQASQYFVAASRNAAARFAFREAADLAVRGLKCLDLTTGVEHSHVLQRELQLTFARLVPLASIEGYASPQAERMSRRLVELGELLGDVPATAAALSATWMIRVVRGEIAAAKAAGVRFVSLARAAANQTLLMNAHMHAQIACHHLGEFQEAQEHSAATLALAPHVPHAERRITIFDPVVASLAESSRNRWITGCLKLALCDADAAVSLGREVRHPDSLAFALVFHGMMSGMRGNWAQCLASTDEGIAVAQDADSVQTLAWNHTVHGWALAHLGRVEEGLAEMVQGIESSRAIMGHVAAPQFSAHMAEVLLLDGQVDEAAACLEGAINLMDANGDTYFAAELHRLTGRCLAASGEEPSALKHLRTALEVAKSQGAKLFELRAALALAEHNRREGCVPLTEALSAFPEPEPWPDVQAARALADRLRL
jgi:predicted ATPase